MIPMYAETYPEANRNNNEVENTALWWFSKKMLEDVPDPKLSFEFNTKITTTPIMAMIV